MKDDLEDGFAKKVATYKIKKKAKYKKLKCGDPAFDDFTNVERGKDESDGCGGNKKSKKKKRVKISKHTCGPGCNNYKQKERKIENDNTCKGEKQPHRHDKKTITENKHEVRPGKIRFTEVTEAKPGTSLDKAADAEVQVDRNRSDLREMVQMEMKNAKRKRIRIRSSAGMKRRNKDLLLKDVDYDSK